jgi:hypothetical protein
MMYPHRSALDSPTRQGSDHGPARSNEKLNGTVIPALRPAGESSAAGFPSWAVSSTIAACNLQTTSVLNPPFRQSAHKRLSSGHNGRPYEDYRLGGARSTPSASTNSRKNSYWPHLTPRRTKRWFFALPRQRVRFRKFLAEPSFSWQPASNNWSTIRSFSWLSLARSGRLRQFRAYLCALFRSSSRRQRRCAPSDPSCEPTRRRRLGMNRLEALHSIRVGEIRLEDIQQQTRPIAGEIFELLALRGDGIPVVVRLRFVEKWGARSWHLQLGCPCCGLPCRRLRDRGDAFYCARCAPRQTKHQQLKNTKSWREGGKTTAAIVQLVTNGSDGRHERLFSALQRELVRDLMDRTEAALSLAVTALELTDAIVSESEHGPKARRQRSPSRARTETE